MEFTGALGPDLATPGRDPGRGGPPRCAAGAGADEGHGRGYAVAGRCPQLHGARAPARAICLALQQLAAAYPDNRAFLRHAFDEIDRIAGRSFGETVYRRLLAVARHRANAEHAHPAGGAGRRPPPRKPSRCVTRGCAPTCSASRRIWCRRRRHRRHSTRWRRPSSAPPRQPRRAAGWPRPWRWRACDDELIGRLARMSDDLVALVARLERMECRGRWRPTPYGKHSGRTSPVGWVHRRAGAGPGGLPAPGGGRTGLSLRRGAGAAAGGTLATMRSGALRCAG